MSDGVFPAADREPVRKLYTTAGARPGNAKDRILFAV